MRTAEALLAALLASQPALASTPEPVDAPHPGQVVHVGGFVFVVPQPGSGVSASVLLAKGGERSAGVTTLRDGTVVVRSHAVRPGSESAAATPVDACEDGAYAFNNSKWERTYRWRFRARSPRVPSRSHEAP